jgi:hypothetical protein
MLNAMLKTIGLGAVLFTVAISPLRAQWTGLKDNIPRNKDGSPNMTAPAPRRPDGKPDLSGIWYASPFLLHDTTEGLAPGVVQMTPAGQAIFDSREGGKLSGTEPDANCLPQGIPKIEQTPLPFKIIQQPNLVVVLYEAFGQYRQFFLDGRPLPKDPNPQWYGYSIAHWDGDTLVVESSGMNGKVWLDQAGHPSSEQMRTTERFHRIDFGHLQIQTTIDDPVMYKKPWTVTQPELLMSDSDLLENVCNENNVDLPHLSR